MIVSSTNRQARSLICDWYVTPGAGIIDGDERRQLENLAGKRFPSHNKPNNAITSKWNSGDILREERGGVKAARL